MRSTRTFRSFQCLGITTDKRLTNGKGARQERCARRRRSSGPLVRLEEFLIDFPFDPLLAVASSSSASVWILRCWYLVLSMAVLANVPIVGTTITALMGVYGSLGPDQTTS